MTDTYSEAYIDELQDEISDLRGEVGGLERKIDTLEKDAERYRYWRKAGIPILSCDPHMLKAEELDKETDRLVAIHD